MCGGKTSKKEVYPPRPIFVIVNYPIETFKESFMLTFRRITPADYEAVSGLMQELHEYHAAERGDVFFSAKKRTFEEFCEYITGDGAISLLAEESGSVIAYVLVKVGERLCPKGVLTAMMEELYVIPSARRGKIGTMLYRMAEREARDRGAVRLDLIVWDFNDGATAFYRKMGFSSQRIVMEKDITVERFECECGK